MSEKQSTPEEKYFSYYVETLTQTLNQQILSNVSSTARAKVNGEILQDWQKENESLKQQLAENNSQSLTAQEDLKKQIEQLKVSAAATQSSREQQQNAEIDGLKKTIVSKDEQIKSINNSKDEQIKRLQIEINRLNLVAVEYDKIKHQVGQIDVFRTELIKHQKLVQEKDGEIQNVINQKNDELQIALDKKDITIDELNKQIEYLKLTPAKRKKLESQNNPVPPVVDEVKTEEVVTDLFSSLEEASSEEVTQEETNETIRDGGSF